MKEYFAMLESEFNINSDIIKLGEEAEKECEDIFLKIKKISDFNQLKVLNSFKKLRISPNYFSPSYGYGYSDLGRDKLEELFADVFGCESAIVRPQIVSGTHALCVALFGLLKCNQRLVSLSGAPYDTLHGIIGLNKEEGSLYDLGIVYDEVGLKHGQPDLKAIADYCAANKPDVAMIQRSRGYLGRDSISVLKIKEICSIVKEVSPDTVIMVDNCYGEFVETLEPTQAGADVMVGSLIKNPGGGMAPTGAYIVGKENYIEQISYRLTSPGIGREVGSYAASYLPFYQGLFMAPHIVGQALMGAVYTASLYSKLGFEVSPKANEDRACIIQTIKFETPKQLIKFIQAIQINSPVESHVVPEPWDMPGYSDQVIMAAGTFVQGASIELSADAPIRPPYIAFMQGGLVFQQVKAAVLSAVEKIR